MFTQFLGTAATVYGVLAALKTLLQTQQMLARRIARSLGTVLGLLYRGHHLVTGIELMSLMTTLLAG